MDKEEAEINFIKNINYNYNEISQQYYKEIILSYIKKNLK